MKSENLFHIPVLGKELIEILYPQPNQNFIDCTLGLGGHAEKILEKTKPKGKLLGIDQDRDGLNEAKKKFKKFSHRVIFIHDNFVNVAKIVQSLHFPAPNGIIFDLGFGSYQLEKPIGLSFSQDQPLDMRLNPDADLTAKTIVNRYGEKKIADILYQYGDIRKSWLFAKRIALASRKHPIETTSELVAVLGTKNPKVLAPIFQALRIVVNNELENLQRGLKDAFEILRSKGKIAVISFHSGEDRIVKNYFRELFQDKRANILTKKPIIAEEKEIKINPRARSAKLRIIEKI